MRRKSKTEFRPIAETELSIVDRDRAYAEQVKAGNAARIAAERLRAAARNERVNARWFCLKVETGKEFVVENILTGADVEAVAPREKGKVVMKKDVETQLPDRPLIRGYVFVRCPFSASAFHGLLQVKHVSDLVGGQAGPYVMSDADIGLFKALTATLEEEEIPRVETDKSFTDGDEAEIAYGPFKGYKCVILSVKWSRQARARILIKVGDRSFEIESMPLAFLRKL